MLSRKKEIILLEIADTLSGRDIMWVVTGSAGFVLQGFETEVHDLDLQTDRAGAHQIAACFPGRIAVPVRFCGTERVRSHFGRLEWDGEIVELMGDMEKRSMDGSWDTPPALGMLRRFVDLQERKIPVLPLDYEADAYERMGRTERAQALRRFLRNRDG